jgi:hypothetical protein
MEYMAMGKPVVAFDLPENRVTLGDGALYAHGNDVRELAGLIARLIDDPAERALLGRRGRQRVVDHWSWERQQRNLIDLYDALLGCDKRENRVWVGGSNPAANAVPRSRNVPAPGKRPKSPRQPVETTG